MLACIDVQYGEKEGDPAKAAIVAFDSWRSGVPREQHVLQIDHVAPYESGAFYKRELPCILTALNALSAEPQIVIVDGYVWLGEEKPGLGARLYAARQLRTVVGVAKAHFVGTNAAEVLRGESKKPLWVSEIGEPVDAEKRVQEMHGAFRLPTMLRLVDQLCRGTEPVVTAHG
jgi:deoxyribonuclease V